MCCFASQPYQSELASPPPSPQDPSSCLLEDRKQAAPPNTARQHVNGKTRPRVGSSWSFSNHNTPNPTHINTYGLPTFAFTWPQKILPIFVRRVVRLHVHSNVHVSRPATGIRCDGSLRFLTLMCLGGITCQRMDVRRKDERWVFCVSKDVVVRSTVFIHMGIWI